MLNKIKHLIFRLLLISLLSCSSANNTLPDFILSTIDNQIVNSNTLKDKTVIINFWATSCSTCIAEMPKLIQLYNKYKHKNLYILAIAMPYDAPMYVKNFAQSRQLPFIVAMDIDGKVSKLFDNVSLTPTTFVYSKNKRLQKIIGQPEWENFDNIINNSLN